MALDDKYWSNKFERMIKDISKLTNTPFVSWKQRMEARGFSLKDIETTEDCSKSINSRKDQIRLLEKQIDTLKAEIVVFENATKMINQEKNFNNFILLCKYLNAVSKQLFIRGNYVYAYVPFYTREQDSNINEETEAVRYIKISWRFPNVDKPIEPGQEELKMDFSQRYTFSNTTMYHCLRNLCGRNTVTVQRWPGLNKALIDIQNIVNENFKPEMLSSVKNADSVVLKNWIMNIMQKEVSRSTAFTLNKIRGAIHGKGYGI